MSDSDVIKRLIGFAKEAHRKPGPDVANVSDAEYKLVCQFHSAIPALENYLDMQTQIAEVVKCLERIIRCHKKVIDKECGFDCIEDAQIALAKLARHTGSGL